MTRRRASFIWCFLGFYFLRRYSVLCILLDLIDGGEMAQSSLMIRIMIYAPTDKPLGDPTFRCIPFCVVLPVPVLNPPMGVFVLHQVLVVIEVFYLAM